MFVTSIAVLVRVNMRWGGLQTVFVTSIAALSGDGLRLAVVGAVVLRLA